MGIWDWFFSWHDTDPPARNKRVVTRAQKDKANKTAKAQRAKATKDKQQRKKK